MLLTKYANIVLGNQIANDGQMYLAGEILFDDKGNASNITSGYLPLDPENSALVGRRFVDACKGVFTYANCVSSLSLGSQVAFGIAGLVQEWSDKHQCGLSGINVVSGGNGELGYFKYQSTGRNCDTTSTDAQVESAVKTWIDDHTGGSLCKFACLKLSHGGTWNGYVTFGLDRYYVDSVRCDDTTQYTDCSTGSDDYTV